MVHHPAVFEVRLAAGHQHLADCKVRLGAMQVPPGS
jgi:hypothetical protein